MLQLDIQSHWVAVDIYMPRAPDLLTVSQTHLQLDCI